MPRKGSLAIVDVMAAWGRAFSEGRYADALDEVERASEILGASGSRQDLDYLARLAEYSRAALHSGSAGNIKSPCSFCGKPVAPGASAVLGVEDSICAVCLVEAVNLLEGRGVSAKESPLRMVKAGGAVCSFCRVAASKTMDAVIGRGDARICAHCVQVALDAVKSDGAP